MALKELAGQKFGGPHKTAKQLFEQGRKCFVMMIEPQNVKFKTGRERREFERGYYKTKIKWIETNPLIPEFFRELDRPRAKRNFRPRTSFKPTAPMVPAA